MNRPTIDLTEKVSHLDGIWWNVYVHHDPDDVERELREVCRTHEPDVVYLAEAKNLHRKVRVPGYRMRQLRPRKEKRGRASETANIAVLIRNGRALERVFTMRMTREWKGPKLGGVRAPRVFRGATVKINGTRWHTLGLHIPFGDAARAEAFHRERRWLSRGDHNPDPRVAFVDQNLPMGRARETIAAPTGSKVGGVGIDQVVYKNCELVDVVDLGHRGSDHPMLRIRLRHTRKVKRRRRGRKRGGRR